jgi:hypothetical protein
MNIDVAVAARSLALGLCLACSTVVSGDTEAMDPASLNEPTVADVLERIERYQRVELRDPDSLYKGLERMNSPVAELELALLELYGPQAVRNRRSGLERMAWLNERGDDVFSQDLRRLLRVLDGHHRQAAETESHCREVERALAAEREEHRETQDRLRALRMIERQLEDTAPEPEAGGSGDND